MSNPSSGKMGYALAEAALRTGWEVDLVSGPTSLLKPEGAIVYPVVTGEEMFCKINSLFELCDILIMTAAVMDYRPRHYSEQKVKKTGAGLVVELEPVVDILKTVAAGKKHQLVVGFAAETENIEAFARRKLIQKNADFIVANQVGVPDSGFEADNNRVTLIDHSGEACNFGPESKLAIAKELIARFSFELRDR